MSVSITIFLILVKFFVGLFSFLPLLFSCDLITNFGIVFGFVFLLCECIYCRFLVCGYLEVVF